MYNKIMNGLKRQEDEEGMELHSRQQKKLQKFGSVFIKSFEL